MANLSPETQAIIDRLKAEGDLVRNSGTNSVRSVKFQLDKFESIFNVISNNIAEQTDMMRLQLGMQSEAVERSNTREQFAEIETQTPLNNQTDDDKRQTPLKDVGNKTGDAIAKALNMKNLALGAAGLFVGFNLLKGYIDEETKGGFSKMQASIGAISWDDVTTSFTGMTAAMSAINWTNFSSAINSMADTVNTFTTWIGGVGIGDIVSTVVAGGLVSAGAKGAMMGLLGTASGVGMAGKLAAIGPGIALAAAGLAVYYGDDIANWLGDQMGVEDAETIENMATTIKFGGVALSIGAMFGPPGLLVAAAATAAVGLGLLIHGWIKKTKIAQAEKFNADVDAALALADAEADASNMSEDTTAAIAHALSEARRRTRLAIGDSARTEAEAAQAQLEALLSMQNIGDGTESIDQLQIGRIREQAMTGDQAAVDELMAWAQGREQETSGTFSRWMFGEKDPKEYIRSLITGMGPELGQNDDINEWEAARDAWEDRAAQILEERGYRRGTGGFKNFGSGTAAILHGTEAVVPLNSPEGQILKNLFNGNTPADVVSNAGSSYGGAGAPMFISAPTIAPSSLNITNGGSTVSQLSVSGGGGGGYGSANPYGLTSAFS